MTAFRNPLCNLVKCDGFPGVYDDRAIWYCPGNGFFRKGRGIDPLLVCFAHNGALFAKFTGYTFSPCYLIGCIFSVALIRSKLLQPDKTTDKAVTAQKNFFIFCIPAC